MAETNRTLSPAEQAAAKVVPIQTKQGTADYLHVRDRIAWWRADHPQGQLTTGLHELTPQWCVAWARVVAEVEPNPAGGLIERGVSMGYGSELASVAGPGNYVEQAETRAIGRALNTLGYGLASIPDDPRPDSAPIERQRPRLVPAAEPAAPAQASLPEALEHAGRCTGEAAYKAWAQVIRLCGVDPRAWRLALEQAPSVAVVARLLESAEQLRVPEYPSLAMVAQDTKKHLAGLRGKGGTKA